MSGVPSQYSMAVSGSVEASMTDTKPSAPRNFPRTNCPEVTGDESKSSRDLLARSSARSRMESAGLSMSSDGGVGEERLNEPVVQVDLLGDVGVVGCRGRLHREPVAIIAKKKPEIAAKASGQSQPTGSEEGGDLTSSDGENRLHVSSGSEVDVLQPLRLAELREFEVGRGARRPRGRQP